MCSYRCYFARAADNVSEFATIEAADIDAAMSQAHAILNANAQYSSVELFDDDHCLGTLKRTTAPGPDALWRAPDRSETASRAKA